MTRVIPLDQYTLEISNPGSSDHPSMRAMRGVCRQHLHHVDRSPRQADLLRGPLLEHMIYSMVRPAELPRVDPHWNARDLTPHDVVALANRQPVPGLNPHHPVVQAIQRASVGTLGRAALNDARKHGYLWLVTDRSGTDWLDPTEYIWGWWCAAARRAEVVVRRYGHDCRVRVDLSSMDARWNPAALPEIGRLIAGAAIDAAFLIAPDTLEVDRLDEQGALSIARGVVDLLADRRWTSPL